MDRSKKLLYVQLAVLAVWILILVYAPMIVIGIISGIVVGWYAIPNISEFLLQKYESAKSNAPANEDSAN